MNDVFFISDTHFSHDNICKFLTESGEKQRPWDNVCEMDEYMINKWNSLVTKKDKVYHLGDVVMKKQYLPIMNRLNGRKVLIMGNHDIFPATDYLQYFVDIKGYHVLNNMIISHIPVHADSKGRFLGNIHGHTHSHRMKKVNGVIDYWYQSMCVELNDYSPVPFEDIEKRINFEYALYESYK